MPNKFRKCASETQRSTKIGESSKIKTCAFCFNQFAITSFHKKSSLQDKQFASKWSVNQVFFHVYYSRNGLGNEGGSRHSVKTKRWSKCSECNYLPVLISCSTGSIIKSIMRAHSTYTD